MKLGLGTAQFGSNYGISNRTGRVPAEEVRLILEEAGAAGVQYLDTAFLYGQSEEVLGRALPGAHNFRIVTKTQKFPDSRIDAGDGAKLVDSFGLSLLRLRQPAVYALLIHSAQDLLKPGGEHLFEAILQLRIQKRVAKVGVSIYSGDEIERILDRFPIDIIQIPINVFDQRLISGKQLEHLKAREVEIHARSIFLQGLLLMAPEQIPSYFEPMRNYFSEFHREMARHDITPLEGALVFIRQHSEIDVAVVGVSAVEEFRQILAAAEKLQQRQIDFSRFAYANKKFLDPSRWEIVT